MEKFKIILILLSIFLLALFLRFLYFPNDIYFGIDQATGSFAVKEILNGNLKLIGPTTSFPGLRHGVLYYYLYAPFYLFGNGDPAFAAIFLRVVNALGVFLIFLLSSVLFNKYVGVLAAILYAVSFEQTQFALYFNHPSLSITSILIMYLGLALLIFRKKTFGLVIALFGLGLSIQFEFILTYLFIPFLLILFLYRKSIPCINKKIIFFGLLTFIMTVTTFLIAEIKFSFKSFKLLPELLFENNNTKSLYKIFSTYFFETGQVIKFSLISLDKLRLPASLLILFSFLVLLFSKSKKELIFLAIWFFSSVIVYFVTGGEDLKVLIIQYHPNAGVSLSLFIFVSFLLYMLGRKVHFILTILIILLISWLNFSMIQKINPYGSMPEINAQSFMLLSDEKKVLDFIYEDAAGQPFAVKGITMPYIINTTWSYLFEWYGFQKYGYLPTWNGKNALGYEGNLRVQEAQEGLPANRYLIIEPVRGIPLHLIDQYLTEESYFTDILVEKKIGAFVVQKRKAK